MGNIEGNDRRKNVRENEKEKDDKEKRKKNTIGLFGMHPQFLPCLYACI